MAEGTLTNMHYSLTTSSTSIHINHMLGVDDNNSANRHLRSFHHAYKQGILTDISLKLQEKVLKCHKGVLFAKSQYLKTFFTTLFEDSSRPEVDLSDLDPDSVEQVIEYCYTGKISFDKECLDRIVETVNFLGIDSILSECDYYIMCTLTRHNAVHCYSLSKCLELPITLKRIEMKYLDLIHDTQDFRSQSYDYVWRILTSEDLDISSEITVLKAAESWLISNQDKDPSGSLLRAVQKMFLPPPEDLKNTKPEILEKLENNKEYTVHRKVFCEKEALIFRPVESYMPPAYVIMIDPHGNKKVIDGPPNPWSAIDVSCGSFDSNGFYCMAIYRKKEIMFNPTFDISSHELNWKFENDNALVIFLYDYIERKLHDLPMNRDVEVTVICHHVTIGTKLYILGQNYKEDVMYSFDVESKDWNKLTVDQQLRHFTTRCQSVVASDKDVYILQHRFYRRETDLFYKYEPQNDRWLQLQTPEIAGTDHKFVLLSHNKSVYLAVLFATPNDEDEVKKIVVAKYDDEGSNWVILNTIGFDRQSIPAGGIGLAKLYNGQLAYCQGPDTYFFNMQENTWEMYAHACPFGEECRSFSLCGRPNVVNTKICVSIEEENELSSSDGHADMANGV